MKNKIFEKGFTLIELLMVVALIAILATVVLAFLGSAREQGRDSAIQTEMKSLANQVALSAGGGDFTTVLNGGAWSSPDPKLQEILTSINGYSSSHTANVVSNAWAAQVRLVSDPSKYFCVDASGQGSVSGTQLGTGITNCP